MSSPVQPGTFAFNSWSRIRGSLAKYFWYESDYYFHQRRPQMVKDTRSQRHNRKPTMICMTQNCIELQTKRAAQNNRARAEKTEIYFQSMVIIFQRKI